MTETEEKTFGDGVPSEADSGEGGACKPRPCWQTLLLGLAAGSGGSLIGVGGGIIMVPILTIWGYTQKRAQGTSLAVIVAMVPLSIIAYWRLGNIDFNFAIPLAIGGVIGGLIGSNLALRFSNRLLARLFGIFLILIALRLVFMPTISSPSDHVEFMGTLKYIETALLGGLAGIAAGFFGVGGGVVFVPTGVLLAGLAQSYAQGSSLTAMLPTAFVGAMNYRDKGMIEWSLVRWMVPGVWVGAILGSWGADVLGQIRDGRVLTILFAVFLLATGVRRLLSSGNAREGDRHTILPNGH